MANGKLLLLAVLVAACIVAPAAAIFVTNASGSAQRNLTRAPGVQYDASWGVAPEVKHKSR